MKDPSYVAASYTTIWRGVLAKIAHWPQDRILEFLAHWEKYQRAYGQYSMLYHAFPSEFVVPFLISDSLRDRLSSSRGPRHVCELEAHIVQEIELATTGRQHESIDWGGLRGRIATILAEYSEEIASFDKTLERWKNMLSLADTFGREDEAAEDGIGPEEEMGSAGC